MALYINNFRGRAGRKERAKQLVDEFAAIEAAFTRLQALNIASYLTIYTNITQLSGVITLSPDNGFLQELTLTSDAALQIAVPLNENQYRMALLIHGSNFKVTNLWGAQTWKEYGLGNWWDLYTGEGPYASALLEFYWDICSHTWMCVASTKNQFNLLEGGTAQRLYPLRCNLSNIEGDDTLGFDRNSFGMTIDDTQAYHYLTDDVPRFHGARYTENWCATPSDLTSVAWVDTDCTVTTDATAGPAGEDVQRLEFTATGGKLATFILPSFGRASRIADPIKVAVSFKARGVGGAESVRVRAAFMGKGDLTPPVHDQLQVALTGSWGWYGCVLNVAKEDNDPEVMTLDNEYPRTLLEIAFLSPSGSTGGPIQVTDVQIEVLRATDEETVSPIADGGIGASMTLTATGTGTWVNGTKTLTLATVGQSMDFAANLKVGKSYLVNPRLQSGTPADIRMVNEQTVWAAGNSGQDLYLQDAPFSFQYEGGLLKFVLTEGSSAVYLLDIYEMTGQRSVSCYQNLVVVGENGQLANAVADPPIPVSSGILDGVAREIASTNLIPYAFFRTFSAWDAAGLSGVDANDCRKPVFQSEYGIDQWPARATILQGASKFTDGFIQRLFAIPQTVESYDFQMWIRRTLDPEGNQIYFPQHNEVTTPLSRYVDFEAELVGGASAIGGNRIRLDLQNATFDTTDDTTYGLGIFKWDDWYHIVISLTNDGTHDGFRVRVYPASADVPDASIIDVTKQGWVVIDWAQFEVSGGTHGGSSPIIGAMTRVTENFTSGLPDGYFYRLEGMVLAATLTSGNLIWELDDGVYENLLYSTTLMIPAIVSRNMHEFGLVAPEGPAQQPLTIVTTTLYPIEVTDSLQLGCDISSGELRPIPNEPYRISSDLLGITLPDILLSYGPDNEPYRVSGTVLDIELYLILISYGPDNEPHRQSGALLGVQLISKLVTGDTPDEKLQLACDINPADCSMTAV